MARRVFFSFHYDNDINRSMTVRNSWVTQGKEAAGFIDKAEFENVKRQGEQAVHNWIDKQLEGTSVTVVLIGADTLNRPFVQYEICQSLQRNNGVIALASNDTDKLYFLIAYIPILIFWGLDAYYLRQERLYRELYNLVRDKGERQIDFSMDTSISEIQNEKTCYFNCFLSITELWFYLPLALLSAIIIIITHI